MKKIYLGLILITFISCSGKHNSSSSSNDSVYIDTTEVSSNNRYTTESRDTEEAENDLPTSKYFEVSHVHSGGFVDGGRFKGDVVVKNISTYNFSTVFLRAEIEIKMKNSDFIYKASASIEDLKPRKTENWKSNEVQNLIFATAGYVDLGGVQSATYDRTPESIVLVFYASATSVDIEASGAFCKFDLMDKWKEKQEMEGHR